MERFSLRHFAVVCLLIGAVQADAASYYVRTDGNDSNNGNSPATAWKTIQKAAASLGAGDTVYIGVGTYNQSVHFNRDGTAADPIRFVAESAGNVVVTTSASRTFDFSFANHIHFDGLKIQGGSGEAIQVRNGVGIVFANCDISNSDDLIDTQDSEVTVIRCKVHNASDQAFEIRTSSTLLVQDSEIYAAAYDGFHTNGDSTNATITIERCRIYNNGRHGVRTEGSVVNVSNCLISGNGYGSYGYGEGVHVQSNSFCLVQHCTIVNNQRYGMKSQGGGSATLKNSIVASNGGFGLRAQSGGSFSSSTDYNLLYANGTANYKHVTPGPNDVVQDPLFVGGGSYCLQSASPAVDSGTGAMSIDLDGKPRPHGAGVDRGCYEDGPAIFYVRISGDDNNNGSSAAQAFRSISRAADVVSEGAVVHVGAGTYLEGVVLQTAGTSDDPILFLADITGSETGDAGPVIVTPPVDMQYGWSLQNADYTTLQGFRISGDGEPQANGLSVDNSQSVTIKDCEIDNTLHGIYSQASALIIDNCLVRNTTTAGIWLKDATDPDLQVTDLVLTDNGQYGLFAESCQLTFDANNISDWAISGSDHLFAASGGTLTLDGITVSGGTTAGIYAINTALTVNNVSVQNNGYGVAAVTSTVLIENATLSQNNVGLFSHQNSSVTVRDCAIHANTIWGAAVYASAAAGATVTFENATVYNNVGGVTVLNASDGDVLLRSGTVIRDNTGAGLHFVNCSLTVNDQASGTNWSSLRNGISCEGSTLTLEGLTVVETTAYAIYSTDSDLTVRNCTLTGHDGIYCGNNSSSTVDATYLISTVNGVDNWGIYRNGGDVLVRNSVIYGFDNGIYLTTADSVQADVLNSTIVNATGSGFHLAGGPAQLVNTVVTGNSGQYGVVDGVGQLTHSHNLVYGFATPFQGTAADATEILKHPRFADAAAGDYHLAVGSPAINAGIDLGLQVPVDLEGNARPSFRRTEIGAYEYTSASGSFRVLDWQEKK